jgi:hypothetical protein
MKISSDPTDLKDAMRFSFEVFSVKNKLVTNFRSLERQTGDCMIRVLGYDPREHWVLWNTNTTHSTPSYPANFSASSLRCSIISLLIHLSGSIHSLNLLRSIPPFFKGSIKKNFNYPQIPYPISRVGYNPPHTVFTRGYEEIDHGPDRATFQRG